MRASAFSHGVLSALDQQMLNGRNGPRPMTETIDFLAGVSGGSIPAAYFGLHGRAGLANFPERFLYKDAEQGFDTRVSISNALKILGDGGVNDNSRFPKWLDENVFGGATYADLFKRRKPIVWISASDIYNRVPFTFEPLTFNAICSDLSRTRISEAVAASAAVPGVFSPLNVENFGNTCNSRMPGWMTRAINDRTAPAMQRASALAMQRIRSNPEQFRYLKLLDGGLTDNYGVQPLTVMRENRTRGHVPLTEEQGARIRRMLFLVIDSGRGPAGDWTRSLASPSAFDLAGAVTDAAIDAGSYKGFDSFAAVMNEWQEELRKWRCTLSSSQVARLRGSASGWNCRDVKFFVGRVTFDDVGADRARLDAVPTRFKLDQGTVDLLISSGASALQNNPTWREFHRSLGGRPATIAAR
jgi:predicted acylesterase/phospholipase RssA